MRKFLFLIPVLFVVLAVVPAVAQEQLDIMELESSMIMGYDLETEEVDQTQRFGVNFNLSESLDVGFLFQQNSVGGPYNNTSFLLLRYALAEQISLGFMIGNPETGVSVSYDLLSNNVQDISTVLRMNMEYMVNDITGPVDEGIFGVSLSLGFGI